MAGTTLTLTPDGFRGRVLGKYEVLCRLSTGGMAEIFLAAQKGLAGFRKMVVLKQILPDIRGEEEFVRMFLDEAKVTAAFNHPHIAHVYDLDVADGELFLAMEFVPGATLVEVARACRSAHEPIPMGLSLMAVRDTAVALNYAHAFTDPLGQPSPVVHRDVAEKNIMVTYEGVTKLLDFGIAKSLARAGRTAVGMVKGTSGYMSPEQIMGDPLDARSDLFSLGVVLHECLTGMRLFYAKSADAMMNAVLSGEVTPPSRVNKEIPPELDAIVLKALAKRREDRYGTTLEFARAIERAVGPRIWHPEQSSELMMRLFSERRDQTRLLLMSGQATGNGSSSETQVAQVLARGAELPEPAIPGLPQGVSTPPRAPTPVAPSKPPAPARASPPTSAPVRRNTTEELVARKTAAAPTPSRRVSPPTPEPLRSQSHDALSGKSDDSEAGARTQPALAPVVLDPLLRITPSTVETSPGYVEGETILTPMSRVATPPAEDPRARGSREPPTFVTPEEPRARAGRDAANGAEDARPKPPREAVNGSAEDPRSRPSRDAASGSAEDNRARSTRDAANGSADDNRSRSARDAANGSADDNRSRPSRNGSAEDSRPRPPRDAVNSGAEDARGRSARDAASSAPEDSRPRPPRASTQDSMRVTLPHNAMPATLNDNETSISRAPNRSPEGAPENTPAVRRAASSRRKQSTPPTRSNGARTAGRTADPHDLPPDEATPRRGRGALIAACVVFLALAGLGTTVALGWDGGRVGALWNSVLGRNPSGKSSTTSPPPIAEPTPQAQEPEPTEPAAPPPTPEPSTALAGAPTEPSDTEPSAPLAEGDSPDLVAADDAQGEKKKPTPARRVKRDADATAAPVRKPRPATTDTAQAEPPEASEAAAPQGFLTLVTEPSARVSLGGRSLGETPLTKVALPVGRHTLKLMDGTGRPLKLLVEIKPDDTTSVRVPLEMLANP
ncbi:protein kinase [Corallococcus sp. BB11-1]|uniref:serine/threonine-protein kinase n=1 Tax=Corallococcus sp. BB11-1 TaxID=2996783 RepID=UPI00226ED972|nr:serine/threonine-protein kinase [Corallococcus sp. BB11-1]MCY1029911.1 protein kinase [Corallococcus sp. BB11-1]